MVVPMPRCSLVGWMGICVVLMAPALVVSGFLISVDPATGVEKYDTSLTCMYRKANTLYRFDYYERINSKTSKYTLRTDTDCCYLKDSRNKCCMYRENGENKCKCSSDTPCGLPPPPRKCADGFHLYLDTTCVGVIKERVTAADAKTRCRMIDPKQQGQLAVIKDQNYNVFIKGTVLNGLTLNVWMGLQRLTSSGQFGWVDNGVETQLAVGSHTDWNTGKPVSTVGADCTIMDTLAMWKWNNVGCDTTKYALCQYKV